ncbi:MAG TPA: GNAT family N-acetyltransferase, partial [Holophagaceae bacterium]|nr:GNAT family N-acetyltransferase [Holophagaceae bacterium]
TDEPVGICGLLKRDYLDAPDIGYALLQRHESKGYAVESASAVLAHGLESLTLPRVVALTKPGNHRSIRVLERIGLRFDRLLRVPGEAEDSAFFTTDPAG